MYEESLKNLEAIGMDIKKDFFVLKGVDAPLLRGMKQLLGSIDTKGLKLTQKGFLPTKVVKSIVDVAATEADKRYLRVQTRFYEEENLSANMARVVAEVLKLIKVQKTKLLLSKKADEFLSLNEEEQYIVLLNVMLGINLGYFDRHQEALCVHHSSVVMLQLLRDRKKDFRSTGVYTALLLDSYPMIENDIETLELYDYGEKDKLDIFASIAETRLFERLFLPLGLVEMKFEKYPEENKFAKSKLLDILMNEKHAIQQELVLSKKRVKIFEDSIRKNRLDINLFETTMYLFAQYANMPLPPKEEVLKLLMQKHSVIGTLRSSYEELYTKLIESVLVTYEEFTQLDTVGSTREDIMSEYINMTEALCKMATDPKPFTTLQRVEILPAFVFDILKFHHNLDQFTQDFILECSKLFDEEFAMDIGHFMLLLEQLQKDAKKLKKSKPRFEQVVKEFIQTYMMLVLELRSKTL